MKNLQETLGSASTCKKVYFVGIHNKPGMLPLDSKTKTGKVIDAIINLVEVDCEKVNLFDLNYIPEETEDHVFLFKNSIPKGSILVLLGRDVQRFLEYSDNCILPYHPGYVIRKGREAIDEYVTNISELIKISLQKSLP